MSETDHAAAIREAGDDICKGTFWMNSGWTMRTERNVREINSHADAIAAQLAAERARTARWKARAVAWERYDHAYMLLTEPEIDEAHRVLVATENQLREHGDLDESETQP